MVDVGCSLSVLQASRLRGVLDVCVEFVRTSLQDIDLFGGDISSGVQSGCLDNQCVATSSFTLTSADSFLEFSVEERVTSYLKLVLEFQTRLANTEVPLRTCQNSSNAVIGFQRL